MSHSPITRLTQPIQHFIQQEKSGGLVLGISVIIALILANSPLKEAYHHFYEQKIGLQWNDVSYFNMSLHHWINDGLMAIFFFVVGLELKREMLAGELANPRKALLPIIAAIGGMVVPALIYYTLNTDGITTSGWGIPMATDIAFALGVLYLLGNKIPLGLKIFLTALAIVDDLGAVLVIALFYTSDISIVHLLSGLGLFLLMIIGNKMGIKHVLFYAIIGILGVWTCFLVSGVHATIAAVLAAFAIPASSTKNELSFKNLIQHRLNELSEIDPNNQEKILTNHQVHILEDIQHQTKNSIPPLQRLEHTLHPLVTFIIIPIFAIANAGVNVVDIEMNSLFSTNVLTGVGLGLLVGKVVGVVGFTWICIKLKVAPQPSGMSFVNLVGLGFLAAIGFTMSLFVTNLAFTDELYITQAKVGIFTASIIGGIIGYMILSKNKASN